MHDSRNVKKVEFFQEKVKSEEEFHPKGKPDGSADAKGT